MVSDNIRRIDRRLVSASRQALYRKASGIALVGNVFLFGIKAAVSFLSHSSAFYADAANSASDIVYSLLMTVGLWLSLRPPDRSHPHGHQRIEPLVSIGIAGMMAYAGYEAFSRAWVVWHAYTSVALSLWMLSVPLVTMALKGGMYVWVRQLAKRAASPALAASARDHLSDVLTSGVVLIGVAATLLSLEKADPIAGFVVAIWIFYQAARVIWEALGHLIGHAGSPEIEEAAIKAIRQVPEVLGIEQLIIEHVGPEVRADIHITVDRNMPLKQVHRVSHAVREAVESLDGVDHAFIHVEPDVRDDAP